MIKHLSYVLLPALALSVLAVSAGFAAERADVPEKYKWNTSDLYPTEEAWSKQAADLTVRIPKLAEFQGKLGKSAKEFYTALDAMMNANNELSRLSVYASMRKDEDTRIGRTSEMNQTASDLWVKYASAVSFLRPEILALGEKKVMGFVKEDKRLVEYKPWLEDVLRYTPHTLNAAEEKIAAQADMMAIGASDTYETFTNADFPYPDVTLSTGEKIRLDASAYTRYRALTNREDRDLVFKTFWSAYKNYERTLGSTLNAHIKTHMFNKDVHKYGSCLEAALFDANVPVSVYKQLVSDVHTNLPTLHRYLKLRQRMMGVDQLRYEDLYAPIVKKVELMYTPEQAMQMVMDAVSPLGPKYLADLKTSFDNRWVDFIPTTGKKSGAYSTGVYGVHPYQLQNFTGLYDEVSTLAHESGHSMHSYLSMTNQPYITSDYKTFVAEVASTLNENLLFSYMLGKTSDRDTKLYLLGTHLDGLRTTLFRQTLFAEFELRMHEMAEKGEPVTGEKLTALYLSLLKEYYGDAAGVCKINDLYGVEWAYIPHFYYNFYVYQYATSIMASSMLADNIRAQAAAATPSTAARDAYLKLLASGSEDYPIALLKKAGVDMTTSAPFKAAMKEMNSIMDEMEKLLAENK
ncbi:MAG: oligoendopeptidase F [Elusimicrobiaceae bacterium]